MINSIMILDFWFKECTPKMWFKKDKEFDLFIPVNPSPQSSAITHGSGWGGFGF